RPAAGTSDLSNPLPARHGVRVIESWLELDSHSHPDHAPLGKDARIVDGEPVLTTVAVQILGQECSTGSARLGVVRNVRGSRNLIVRPKARLKIADVLAVEKIRALDVEGYALAPDAEEPLRLDR